MASCQTSRWVSTAPYVVLTVTQSSSDDTTATLSWTLQYKADYAANTNGVGRAYTVKIGGSTVKEDTYNIDGVTGTKTIASGTKTINKTTAAQSISFSVSFAFNVTWSGTYGGTKSASSSISVAAKTSYTVTYNANGGSGAPGKQTKWHGTTLTISSTKPTRTGYTFEGWALTKAEADAGRWYYTPGSSCGRNENLNLYAVWEANTYPVSYNANGGSGAPASQTKTYGQALTLSSTKPTRTNYNFKGWATAASSTTVAYAPGASYTANAGVTLYAVWELAYKKPRIVTGNIARCNSDGTVSDTGTYILVKFNWGSDRTISSVKIEWKLSSSTTWTNSKSITSSGTSGTVSEIIGGGLIDIERTYDIKITVTDAVDSSYALKVIPSVKFTFDAIPGNKGASIGKPAELEGVFDIGFKSRFYGGIMPVVLDSGYDLNNVLTPGIYAGKDTASGTYTHCPLTNNSFLLIVDGAGGTTQIRQYIEACNMTKPVKYERFYYSGTWGSWICLSPTSIEKLFEHTSSAANTWELVGTITIPARKFYTITARGYYNNCTCKGVIIGQNETTHKYTYAAMFNEDAAAHNPSCTYSGVTGDSATTFYLWCKWSGTVLNNLRVTGYYLPY